MKTLFSVNPLWALAILIAASSLTHPAVGQEQSTDYVPKEAFGAVLVGIDQLKKMAGNEFFPHEIVSALGKRDYGIDPADITSAKMIFGLGAAGFNSPPQVGFIVESKKELDLTEQLERLGPATDVDGIKIYYDDNLGMHLSQPNGKTVLFASEEPFVLLMSASKGVRNPFTKLLKDVKVESQMKLVVSIEKIKDLIDEAVFQYPAPPPFGVLNKLHERTQSIEIAADLVGAGLAFKMEATAYTEADAEKIGKAIKQLLKMAKAAALAGVASQMEGSDDPVEIATMDYANRLADTLEKQLTPQTKGKVVTVEFENEVANAGVLVALLLPAVQAAREAARRTSAANGLKQLGLAAHNYHDTHGHFPAKAITDKNGKPLLSWRVAVLPYIEHSDLYERFHLDEPWDSDHNIKLLDEMPLALRNPNSSQTNKTNFLAVSGKGTAFDGKTGKRFQDFKDGTSNTILYVESNKFVPWTKPEDFDVDWDDPTKNLGGLRPGIFQAGFADGSVQAISLEIDAEALISMFRLDDGR